MFSFLLPRLVKVVKNVEEMPAAPLAVAAAAAAAAAAEKQMEAEVVEKAKDVVKVVAAAMQKAAAGKEAWRGGWRCWTTPRSDGA